MTHSETARSEVATPVESGNTVPHMLMRRAETFAGKALVRFPRDRTELTYDGLAASALAGGGRLRHEYGLKPGDSAAIYLDNSAEYVKAWFAFLFAGLVDAPINHEFRKAMLLFSLSTVSAQVLVTDGEGLEHLLDSEVAGYLPKLKLLVLAGESGARAASRLDGRPHLPPVILLDDLVRPGTAHAAWEEIDAASAAMIRFTSGTTGPAKGILQSHLHVLGKSAVHNRILGFGRDDVLYSPFPFHHNLASINGLIGTLQAGGTMVSVSRFSASRYWREARDSGATLGHLLQPLAPLLNAQPPAEADKQHSVRLLWTGGPDPEFEARFMARWIQIYALGEIGVISHMRGAAKGSTNTGAPLPEMEVRIVDALDRPVAPGVSGEITVRPRHPHRVMLAYHNNLPATMRAFRNLWFHTGDAGYVSETGELHFQGRIGDTIRRRGVNMSSEQIENEVRQHADVLDCAVIAVPVESDQEVHACVAWRSAPADPPAAFGALATFLSGRLAREYVPRFFETVTEFPRTGTGKIQKDALRERSRFGPTWDRQAATWLDETQETRPRKRT